MGVDIAYIGPDALPDPWPPHEDPQPNTARTWQPRDLTAALAGDYERPQPTVGARTDGRGLFYPGKAHTVVSESEGGKTWLALSAAHDEIRAGHHVLYVDFEDDEGTIVPRLLTLGVPADQIARQFHYLRPENPIGAGIHRDDLLSVLADHRPTLAILDGVTEAMTMHGLDPNKNPDAALFGRLVVRPITDAGAAAVSLDHVVKDREGRGRYALGAVHKLNGLTGAQYILTNRQPFGVGLTGRSTLRIAKDRPGQLRPHGLSGAEGLWWYGDLVVESLGEDHADVTIEPPHQREETDRPTFIMQRVSEALEQAAQPLSKNVIEQTVRGKAATIRVALSHLVADGYVTNKTPHESIKPYRADSDQEADQ